MSLERRVKFCFAGAWYVPKSEELSSKHFLAVVCCVSVKFLIASSVQISKDMSREFFIAVIFVKFEINESVKIFKAV
jgi:hypothetical protein